LATGAGGYIGRRVVEMALARGLLVTVLGRTLDRLPKSPRLRRISWSFGEVVPGETFARDGDRPPIDCCIHSAHLWVSGEPEGKDENIGATQALLAAIREWDVASFVFTSTVSARRDALNRYGRVKWRIENMLDRPGELAVRIGLAYGGPDASQWGALSRLARLSPVLPMLAPWTRVQPIHLDEVAEGLLNAVAIEAPPEKRTFVLAGPDAIAFGDFLKAVARGRFGRPLWILPIPLGLALACVKLVNRLPTGGRVDEERILGLAGMSVLDSSDDIRDLGLSIAPLEEMLAQRPLGGRGGIRSLLEEARILTRYTLGRSADSETLRRYVRCVLASGDDRPARLPTPARRFPVLLSFAEPICMGSPAPPAAARLRQRLDIALYVLETSPRGAGQMYDYQGVGWVRTALVLVATMTGELLRLPLRAIFSTRS